MCGTCELDTVHYVIVRPDLPRGLLAAQVVHAAGESGGNIQPGTFAVVLAAEPLELVALERRLVDAGVAHAAVRETDAPWEGALMAIGVRPGPRSVLKKHFSGLPLLGEREAV